MARPRLLARGISPAAYRRITLFALLALGFIVVTGAAVRLTGSGLGCPTWPQCEPGSLAPRDATSSHAMIEFVNRLITGLVSVAVILAVAGSLLRRPRRRDLTRWSLALVAGVIGQIVLGGLTVLFHLSPPFVMGHYLLSAVLVGCAVVLHHRAGEPDGPGGRVERRPAATPQVRNLARGLVVLSSAVLFSGTVVTAAGPHGGDADVERLDLALTSVSRVHSLIVWTLVATTVWCLVLARRTGADRRLLGALEALVVIEVGQGALGYLQYFTGVPEGMVLAHVAGSMLVLGAAIGVALRCQAIVPTDSPAPLGADDPVDPTDAVPVGAGGGG